MREKGQEQGKGTGIFFWRHKELVLDTDESDLAYRKIMIYEDEMGTPMLG